MQADGGEGDRAAEKERQAAQRAARQAKKEARRRNRGAGKRAQPAADAAACAPAAEFLYGSCIGQLGSFGNHIVQFAFARALSDAHGLKLVCPPWLGERVFAGGAGDCARGPATIGPDRASRMLLADKMVVGHAEWREWACEYEPLRGIARAEGRAAVTGRRCKKEVPQVNGSCISTEVQPTPLFAAGRLHDSAAAATVVELVGAVQFPPSVFRSQRDRLREVFTLQPPVRDLVTQILAELRRGATEDHNCEARCVVAVHLGAAIADSSSRSCSSVTRKPVDWWRPGSPETPELPAARNSPYKTAHDWCDESTTWDAPLEWLVDWLDESWERLSVGGLSPVLLLSAAGALGHCLDLALLPQELLRFRPRTVEQIMGDRNSSLWAAGREALGDTLTDEALLLVAEWGVQAAADVLVTSNSTVSFSAAWIASMSAASSADESLECDVHTGNEATNATSKSSFWGDSEFPRLWRADPAVGQYITYDPWCTDPLLEAVRAPAPAPSCSSRQDQGLGAEDQDRRVATDAAWLEATALMHSLYCSPTSSIMDDAGGDSNPGTTSQLPLKSSKLEASLQSLATPPMDTTIRLNSLRTDRDSLVRELQQVGVPALDSAPLYDIVPDLIIVPGSGPHEIKLDHPVVCLDRRCGEAVMTGADVFAPGVKGIAPNLCKGDQVSLVVDIDGVSLKGQPLIEFPGAFPGRWRHIGNGIAMMDRMDMIATDARGMAVKMQATEFNRPAMHGILHNLLMVQSLPSLLVSHILAPRPGDRVLDMCASPGGKTTHIATLMENRGLLVALDRTQSKVDDIHQLATRLGLHPGGCIQAQPMDCRKIMDPAATEPVQLPDGRMRYPREYFDRILLDPSCSALGLRPRLLHTASAADLAGYAKLQRLLLRWAVKLLKPNGTLVFSTCTMNPLENEYNVLFCLQNFPLELQPQGKYHIAEPGLPIPGLSAASCANVQRFEPGSSLDTMGFFCAKFRKTASYEDDFV